MTVRGRSGDGYSNRLGPAKFLCVPTEQQPSKEHEVSFTAWMKKVRAASGASGNKKGNVVFFVHGYNTEIIDMERRHHNITKGLKKAGYKGAVIGFDWPSNGRTLEYVFDRLDARAAANHLMSYGIRPFAERQDPDCDVNVHVLAHSMGAFLVREAFDYADDDHATAQTSWTMSQIALVAADISRRSMKDGSANSRSMIRRATRITNYFSKHDEVLSISEIKRVGVSRRLGRVGAPHDRSEKVVNLDCSDLYKKSTDLQGTTESHRWYFESPRFYEDLTATFVSNLDRDVIPGRELTGSGLRMV
jgi:esterase/lipase superfamily enzyme